MSKFSFSLSKLISNLINNSDTESYVVLPDDTEIKPTTVRLEPEIRKFCDVQSEQLGISTQSFISMVLKGVMIESLSPLKSELTIMQERFFEVFKSHKIPVIEIPNFLKEFNITLSMLADPNRLLDSYSPKLLSYISDKFHVNEKWLKGQSSTPCKSPFYSQWYKFTRSLCGDLLTMIDSLEKPSLYILKDEDFDLNNPDSISDSYNGKNSNVCIVVKGVREYSGAKKHSFFIVYQSEPWDYKPCRLDLKSIILFCYLMRIEVNGYDLPKSTLSQLGHYDNILFSERSEKLNTINFEPDDFIDALETNEPYPSSKTQDELFSVFNQFLNSGLDELIIEHAKNKKPGYHNIKKNYLSKICAFRDEGEKGLSYTKIDENENVLSSLINSLNLNCK